MITRRGFLTGASAFALAPHIPAGPVSVGNVDRLHREVGAGYPWAQRLGAPPQFYCYRRDGHHVPVGDNFHVKEA